ncbi:hypothetical protein HDU86_003096 [Geranomyces michiganensis]|nr:hypothetical protein HDU86_003096 [Geranomyces michiganensis]
MRFFATTVLALLAISHTVLGQNATCTRPVTRREFRELSDVDKQRFIDALKCLRNPQRSPSFNPSTGSRTIYDDLVWVHQQNNPNIHNLAAFLPWHRGMLSLLEFWLGSNCGWTGGVPYWDWTLDSQAPQNSVVLSSRWFGGNGNPQLQNCVSNGQFTDVRTVFTNPGTSNCIHRFFNVNNRPAAGPTLINSVAQQALMQNSRSSYASFRNNFESQPHNAVHTSLGGDMFIVTISPNDPLFYLHHANVDRMWSIWQRNNPSLALTYNDFNRQVSINDPLQYNIAWNNQAVVRWFLSTTSGGTMCYQYSNSVAPRNLQFDRNAAMAAVRGTSRPATDNAPVGVPTSGNTHLRPIDPISESALQRMNFTQAEIKDIRKTEAFMNKVTKFANDAGFVSHDVVQTNEWRPVSDDEAKIRAQMLSLIVDAAKEVKTGAGFAPSNSTAIATKIEAAKALAQAWTLA